MSTWLTTAQAAALIGVSRQAIWRWAHAGAIPSTALLIVGSHVRVSRTWVEQRAKTPETPCA